MKTNSDAREQSPKELFQDLQRREAQLAEGLKKMRKQSAIVRFFHHSLFPPDWTQCSNKASKWFAYDAHKYRFLIALLKNKTRDERMFLLATWCYGEGICNPEDLLGDDFKRYEKAGFAGPRGTLSVTRLSQALTVQNWVAYFQKLLRDRKEGRDLRALGYDESAIQAAAGKKRPVQAACHWLATKFSGTSQNLANAHSWFFSEVKSSNPELFT